MSSIIDIAEGRKTGIVVLGGGGMACKEWSVIRNLFFIFMKKLTCFSNFNVQEFPGFLELSYFNFSFYQYFN